MIYSHCRLCHSELFPESLLQLKGMPKAAQYYPRKDEFAHDRGIALNICQCTSCGLVQLNAKPVDYFKEVITVATLSEKASLSRLNQMKELVNKFSLQGKKVLEVGSGKGEMLDVLAKAGLQATGLEASLESVTIAHSAGRKMVHGYIGDPPEVSGSPFDAFISLNYLEHLPDPGTVIRNIYKNCRIDAVGFVTVPNLDYLLKTKCFYEFVADHLSYFTKKTLTHAFEGNGFDVLDMGVNVKADAFLAKAKEWSPNIIGMSSLLTTTMPAMKEVIETFAKAGLRNNYKFIIGGAPLSQRFADEIGADGYGEDAQSGVELVKKLLAS